MEGGILADSEPCCGGGNKATKGKMGKEYFVGCARKKMLTDITNLQQQQHLNPSNQNAKKQSASPAADNCTDQHLKENAVLMKLVANRNVVIESCKAELQKLQGNYQKLGKQNLELAQANNQMLVELNSSRQRLRELQHELGCKNGVLKAIKFKSKEKEHTEKLVNEITANEVGTSQSEQLGQTFQAENRGENLCNAKRRRMSKRQSSAPSFIKQVNSTEKVANKRYCLRRQSKGFKAEKPESTEEFYETDDIKSCGSHLQENLANKKGLTLSGATFQEDSREDTESSGPTMIEQVRAKENIDNKRKQSLRRQSARFKPVDPEPTEDSFEIDDVKFAVFQSCDNVVRKSGPTTSSVTSEQQDKEENNCCKFDAQEVRRSSVGRPLRQAVGKVQSYKEIPLNVKMRRLE